MSRFIVHMAGSGSQAFFKAETEPPRNPVPKQDQICGFEFAQSHDGPVILAQTESDIW